MASRRHHNAGLAARDRCSIRRSFFTCDLTCGSLVGIIIVLLFFWLIGPGVVMGAELNAALAVTTEEEEAIKQHLEAQRRKMLWAD